MIDFREATPGDADEVAALMNVARYFPRTEAEDFLATLEGKRGPGIREAFLHKSGATRIQVQYHTHPYCGAIVWLGCEPVDDERLVEEGLDFIDRACATYAVIVADKFPALQHCLMRRGFRQRSESLCQSLALSDLSSMPASGLDLRDLGHLTGPQTRSLYELEIAVSADVPNFPITARPSYEDFLKSLDVDRPNHVFSVVAVDGAHVLAVARHVKRHNGCFVSSGTGVRRSARGRGLALATKWAGLERIRQAGGRLVDTCNDLDNLAMLHINQRLGYGRLGSQFLFCRPSLALPGSERLSSTPPLETRGDESGSR